MTTDAPDETPRATLAEEIAYLLWQANEGYLTAEDRAVGDNHFLEPVETLHPDDAEERPGWLSMADTLIEALAPLLAGARAAGVAQERERIVARLRRLSDEASVRELADHNAYARRCAYDRAARIAEGAEQ